jgi:hypothetical protein
VCGGCGICYRYVSSVAGASATTLFRKLGMFPLAARGPPAVHVTEYSAVKYFMESADADVAPVLVERWCVRACVRA